MWSWEDSRSYIESLGQFGMQFGLDRITRLLAELGNPQNTYPVIHVAGTNGKGSVCSLLASVLSASGYRTGLYTSPHLVTIRERFQVNGNPVTSLSFTKISWKIFQATRKAGIKLTQFEFLTAMAFEFFAAERVHAAVIETGLGGRLDATNTVANPQACVITSLSLDHTEWLGKTIAGIAREKAGIIKAEAPVVTVAGGEALGVIKRAARKHGCQLYSLGKDFKAVVGRINWSAPWQKINYCGESLKLARLKMRLVGPHQAINASLALATLEQLQKLGWIVTEKTIRDGFGVAKWPGRFEIIPSPPPSPPRGEGVKDVSPLPLGERVGVRGIILDGAHNPDGARVLAETLALYPKAKRKVNVIFGCLKDKDVHGMIKWLANYANKVINVKVNSDRALEPEVAHEIWKEFGCESEVGGSLKEALKMLTTVPDKKIPVLVTGSLYLIGEYLTTGTRG